MAENTEDVLFRLGFTSHPESAALLTKLAADAIKTQKAIDDSMKGVAATAVAETQKVAAANKAMKVGGGGAAGADTTRKEILANVELAKAIADREAQARADHAKFEKNYAERQASYAAAKKANDELAAKTVDRGKVEQKQAAITLADIKAIEQAEAKLAQKRGAQSKGQFTTSTVAGPSIGPLDESQFADLFAGIDKGKEKIKELGGELTAASIAQKLNEAREASKKYGKEAQSAFNAALTGAAQAGEGVAQLGRAYVLLDFATTKTQDSITGLKDESIGFGKNSLQLLAVAQAGIDSFRGLSNTLTGTQKALSNVRKFITATTAARKASAAVTALETAQSNLLTAALIREGVARKGAAAAAGAGGVGRGAAGGIAGGVAGGAAGGAIGGRVGAFFGRIGAAGAATAAAGGGLLAKAGAMLSAAGTVATAAVGVAGAALTVKGISTQVEKFQKGGGLFDKEGIEVNSYADMLGQGAVKIADGAAGFLDGTLEALTGWRTGLSNIVNDEAVERAQKRAAQAARSQAHQDRLERIELDRNQALANAARELQSKLLAIELRGIADPSQRAGVVAAAVQRNDVAIAEARKSQTGLAGAGLDAAKEQERALLEEGKQLRNQQIQLEQEAAAKKQRSLVEEINKTQQVLNIRLQEKKAAEDALKSGAERFGALSARDQSRAKAAFLQAQQQGAASLSPKQLEALSRVQTKEAQDFVSEGYRDRAQKAGFSLFSGTEQQELAKADQQAKEELAKRNKLITEAGGTPGQNTVQQVIDAIKNPTIELIDNRQFEIKGEEMAAAIAERLLAKVAEMEKRVTELTNERINKALDARTQQENEENAARNAQANAS